MAHGQRGPASSHYHPKNRTRLPPHAIIRKVVLENVVAVLGLHHMAPKGGIQVRPAVGKVGADVNGAPIYPRQRVVIVIPLRSIVREEFIRVAPPLKQNRIWHCTCPVRHCERCLKDSARKLVGSPKIGLLAGDDDQWSKEVILLEYAL